jgi:hypothetical protein
MASLQFSSETHLLVAGGRGSTTAVRRLALFPLRVLYWDLSPRPKSYFGRKKTARLSGADGPLTEVVQT